VLLGIIFIGTLLVKKNTFEDTFKGIENFDDIDPSGIHYFDLFSIYNNRRMYYLSNMSGQPTDNQDSKLCEVNSDLRNTCQTECTDDKINGSATLNGLCNTYCFDENGNLSLDRYNCNAIDSYIPTDGVGNRRGGDGGDGDDDEDDETLRLTQAALNKCKSDISMVTDFIPNFFNLPAGGRNAAAARASDFDPSGILFDVSTKNWRYDEMGGIDTSDVDLTENQWFYRYRVLETSGVSN
tara:strand:+ start:61 stop:777 length:717 start_codon:yes stop_codon:yes gene_type:complete